MKPKSISTIFSVATAILLASQQLGSQLMGQCSAPQNPIYTCTPNGPCSFTSQTPAALDCVDNYVSVTTCHTITVTGSSSVYAGGQCSSDGKSCYGAVLVNTVNNVILSTSVSGASCLG